MFRIACFCAFAFVATNAIACGDTDWKCELHSAAEQKHTEYLAEKQHDDEMFMRKHANNQRDNLPAESVYAQQMIDWDLQVQNNLSIIHGH